MHKGSCLCNQIQFQFKESQGDYVYCHCQSCRKASGSAFAANISVPLESFQFIKGERDVKVFESSPRKYRHFCGNCGSPLYTKVGDKPAFVRVRLGSLDTDFNQAAAAHIFMSDAANWDSLSTSIPCFNKWPDSDTITLSGSHQPK